MTVINTNTTSEGKSVKSSELSPLECTALFRLINEAEEAVMYI